METLLKNPITVWLRWLAKLLFLKVKYAGKNLHIEYLAEINASTFSNYNTIRKHARLRDAHLGAYSYIGRESQVYHAWIGNFTCIAPEVLIGLGEHPSKDFVSSHPMFYSTIGQSNPVIVEKNLFDEFPQTIIDNDVWIGTRAVLKTGVSIGNGAVIAAGAVVVKDVEPYSIVGGVPAKHIRYRFTPELINILQKSEWWNKDLDWLRAHKYIFKNIGLFVGNSK